MKRGRPKAIGIQTTLASIKSNGIWLGPERTATLAIALNALECLGYHLLAAEVTQRAFKETHGGTTLSKPCRWCHHSFYDHHRGPAPNDDRCRNCSCPAWAEPKAVN